MDRTLIIPILQRLEDWGPLDPDTRNANEAARYQRYYVEGLRDLLRCTRAALLKGLMKETFPVTPELLEEAFSDLRRPCPPLSQACRERLQVVARDFEVDTLLQDDRQWLVVVSDLAKKRILMYLNGREWYGVHPLLRDVLKPEAPPVAG